MTIVPDVFRVVNSGREYPENRGLMLHSRRKTTLLGMKTLWIHGRLFRRSPRKREPTQVVWHEKAPDDERPAWWLLFS